MARRPAKWFRFTYVPVAEPTCAAFARPRTLSWPLAVSAIP
jgi:hypothetical protein